MPRCYPMMVDLTGKPVLVVGGGVIALDKVELFLKFEAAVAVVSPDLHPDLQAHLAASATSPVPTGRATWTGRPWPWAPRTTAP